MGKAKTTRPLLVIIGPSGTGKSTIIKKLFEEHLIIINPTWTTRPPRPGEVQAGVEHHFTDEKHFSEKVAEGYFLETAKMFALPYSYGLPHIKPSTASQTSLVMLRAQLITLFDKHYKNYLVYQIEDTLSNVEKRLMARVREGEDMGSRLDDYNKEIELGRKLADRIFINEGLTALYQKIKSAILEDFSLL